EALAHHNAGDIEVGNAILRELASRAGLQRVIGLAVLPFVLPALGRGDEARTLADQAVPAARDHGNPFWIAFALYAYGRAHADTDPSRALGAFRDALECAHRNHNAFLDAVLVPDLARLEVANGDLDEGLILFDEALDATHRAGSHTQVGLALANLALVFSDLGRAEIAATIYGSSTRYPSIAAVPSLSQLIEQLRGRLGAAAFDDCVLAGAA